MRKIVDVPMYAASGAVFLLDSDVLFFHRPDELLSAPSDGIAVFNSDHPGSWHLISAAAAEVRWGIRPVARFNSGVGVFTPSSVSLDKVERFLAAPELDPAGALHPNFRGLIEQTLLALLAADWPLRLLPDSYLVSHGPVGGNCRPVARHYAGASRQLMFTEGIPTLVRDGFLAASR
jgi:hypothetical protein